MLSVKRIRAGRGAVDYYVGRERTGLGEYYLADGDTDEARLAVPPSSWWGGSSGALDLDGEVAIVPGDAVAIESEHRAESGEEVVVLDEDFGTVLVYP